MIKSTLYSYAPDSHFHNILRIQKVTSNPTFYGILKRNIKLLTIQHINSCSGLGKPLKVASGYSQWCREWLTCPFQLRGAGYIGSVHDGSTSGVPNSG